MSTNLTAPVATHRSTDEVSATLGPAIELAFEHMTYKLDRDREQLRRSAVCDHHLGTGSNEVESCSPALLRLVAAVDRRSAPCLEKLRQLLPKAEWDSALSEGWGLPNGPSVIDFAERIGWEPGRRLLTPHPER